MKNKFFAVFVAGLFMFCLVQAANADVIVDTGTYGAGTGSSWSLSSYQWLAGQFAIDDGYIITSVEGFLVGASTDSNKLSAAIYTNVNNYPGLRLYSGQFSVGSATDWYGASGLSWSLDPGIYWAAFEVRPLDGDTYDGTMRGSAVNGLALNAWSNIDKTVWYNDMGWDEQLDLPIRISGDKQGASSVPEPSTMLLLGLGLTGLAGARRLKK